MDPAEAKLSAMLPHQQAINDAIALGDSDIQRFYCNVTVFITGGTGFLGKLLIEKLFRSCKIKKMFLLLRSKKGKDVRQRFMEMLKNPVFDILREDQPNFQDRIAIVEGDVALPGLGISDDDWCRLTEEVSVIFHGAATVKFDAALQQATLINVRGTREMLKLGHACKLLRSFVYISTAYSHATDSMVSVDILEQFYPTPVPPDTVIELAETLDAEKMNDVAPSLMSGWSNSYTFSKALAEETVRTVGAGLPVCIVRPAIVISAYHEPLPGWIDDSNLYGANGSGLGLILGIIHVLYAKPDAKIDFIPADFVSNAVIAAGKETGKRWDDGEKEMKIYTVTSARNYLSWAECIRIIHEVLRNLVSPKAVWFIYTFRAENDTTYSLLRILLHELPARAMDGILLMLGKRPKLNLIYKKIHKMSSVLKQITTNDWCFRDDNLLEMHKNMSDNDKIIYNFDVNTMCVEKMMVVWNSGIRKFILKDGLKGTKNSVRKQSMFKVLSFVVLFIYILLFWMLVQFVILVLSMFVNKNK